MTFSRSQIDYCILLTCLFLGSTGCDLFTTRDPEPPTTGSSNFVPPTSADLVLTNLQNAISERNTENYVRCLTDSLSSPKGFLFIPTSAAVGKYPSAFASWSIASEKSYFAALAAVTPKSATSVLVLSGGFTIISSDSAVYNCDYQLTFQHGIHGVPETVRGNLQFILATDRNSFWSIISWTDTPIGNDAGWSELKGRFAN